MSIIGDFVSRVDSPYTTGSATEHSYRSALEALFAALDPEATAVNEPKRVECGAPDFIVSKGEIVIGHVEAKDLHIAHIADSPIAAASDKISALLPQATIAD